MGVDEGRDEREQAGDQVQAAPGGRAKPDVSQAPESRAERDEQQRRGQVAGRDPRAAEQGEDPRQEAARTRRDADKPIGEGGVASEEQREPADEEPLDVHEHGPLVGACGLVDEQQGAVLRLLHVGEVVVDVLDLEEEAEETGPARRLVPRQEVGRRGQGGQQRPDQKHGAGGGHGRTAGCHPLLQSTPDGPQARRAGRECPRANGAAIVDLVRGFRAALQRANLRPSR